MKPNCLCDDCRRNLGDRCPNPECERPAHQGPHRRLVWSEKHGGPVIEYFTDGEFFIDGYSTYGDTEAGRGGRK